MSEPAISDCIRRILVIGVENDTPAELTDRLGRHLVEMPRHIPELVNWSFSRAVPQPDDVWTFVWEFELRRQDDYRAYMNSPFHWGLVDRWFDREWPDRIVSRIMHGYYRSPDSTLAWLSKRNR